MGGGGGWGGWGGQVIKLGFFKANFTLNFLPIGWSWSLRFDPI